MYFFFDVETTGLPLRYNAAASDLDNWPRVVQVAWVATGNDGVQVGAGSHIVKPDGFKIPHEVAKIHRINDERAHREGRELAQVLDEVEWQAGGRTVVCHNAVFDTSILGAEFLRARRANPFEAVSKIVCTMRSSAEFVGIPGRRGFKWPRLAELHRKLFGEDFGDAHDAGADVAATVRCFWELRRRGVL